MAKPYGKDQNATEPHGGRYVLLLTYGIAVTFPLGNISLVGQLVIRTLQVRIFTAQSEVVPEEEALFANGREVMKE